MLNNTCFLTELQSSFIWEQERQQLTNYSLAISHPQNTGIYRNNELSDGTSQLWNNTVNMYCIDIKLRWRGNIFFFD